MRSRIATDGRLMFIAVLFLLLIRSLDSPAATPAQIIVAIKGYDTVAYFKAGKAVKGSDSLTYDWHDLTWHFSSKENRDLFASSPARYAPQYDGYCAWAMTESRLAMTDPEVWKIVDGKLYLNCSQAAYEKWSKDIPDHIKKADAIWKEKFGKK